MYLQNKISIGDGNSNFAEIRECGFSIWKTFTGYRFSFNFTIHPFDNEKAAPIVLDGLNTDLSFRKASETVLLGRMIDNLVESARELKGYEFSVNKLFDIQTDDFVRLIDQSHKGDMGFEFNIKPIFQNTSRQSQSVTGYLKIPHSEWIRHINNAGLDRFELISIRIPVSASHLHTPLVEAVGKIREAEQQYMRGDWNGAASSCRAAWRTVLSAAPPGSKPIEHLLATVTSDPRRKEFVNSLVKGLHDIQNSAVHLEGNVKTGTPAADMSAEDALLCIHWYSAVIGYLSVL